MKKKDISFTLLENGLDFILSGLKNINIHKNKLKYSVLHIFSGVSLILKERLRVNHSALVFSDPELYTEEKFRSGNFQSIDFKTTIKILDSLSSLKLTQSQKQSLHDLHDRRNKIEHFRIQETSQSLKLHLSQVVIIILDFLHDQFEENTFSINEKQLIKEIRTQIATFTELKTIKLRKIEKEVSLNGLVVYKCPICRQKALKPGNGYKCLFCNTSQKSDEKAAHSYLTESLGLNPYVEVHRGDIWPCYKCMKCKGSLVTQTDHESYVAFCFKCGVSFKKMYSCRLCDKPMLREKPNPCLVCQKS